MVSFEDSNSIPVINSGQFPVTTLDGIVYVPVLALYLLFRDAAVDEQRLLHLQSALSSFCGGPVELYPNNIYPVVYGDLSSNHSEEPIVWDRWELSRDEVAHAFRMELHSRPGRFNKGMIESRSEKYLEYLAQEGIIDLAVFPSDPQRHKSKLPFYSWQLKILTRENLYRVAIGGRAAYYIFHMRRHRKSSLWKVVCAALRLNPMSDLEVQKIVSENVEGLEGRVISVVIGPDSRALIKAVNKELRMKLGRNEFLRLIASFV